jgi:hypothetical protein
VAESEKLLIRSIYPSDTELVIPIFSQYFAVEDSHCGCAFISFFPQTLSATEDDAFSAVASSIGYALLSNITNSPDKLITARQKYSVAVRLTCNALQNSTPAETCSIIRIIVLLANFEVSLYKTTFRLQNFQYDQSHH